MYLIDSHCHLKSFLEKEELDEIYPDAEIAEYIS